MHLTCVLHLEKHAILALELQLSVDVFIGTTIVDEDFYLFEIGSGGKQSVAIFWFLDIIPDGAFSRTVEIRSGGNVRWALRVRVVGCCLLLWSAHLPC